MTILLVLVVEIGEVHDQVLDHKHMRQRCYYCGLVSALSMGLRHATVLVPSMLIAQEPHIPSQQDLP